MRDKYLLGQNSYYILFVVCTLCITALLLLPSSAFSSAHKIILWKHSDKVAHSIMFFAESWLLFRCIEFRKNYPFRKISRIVFFSVSIFGLMTEILQGITYNTAKRNFSLWDLLFDVLACMTAIVIINLFSRRLKTKRFF